MGGGGISEQPSSSSSESITHWLREARQGNRESANALWEVYFPQLVTIARAKLADRRDRSADEEDVALSVLESFFAAARWGRFPDLKDRDELWRLLARMTSRKSIDYLRTGRRLRRGRGLVGGESAFADKSSSRDGIDKVAGDDPTPELAMILTEQCEHLLNRLDSPLKDIALKKLEGYTNKEIARQLGCAVATVERRLRLIRIEWQEELRDGK